MTEFSTIPGRECMGEYIKISVYGSPAQKTLKIALIVCTALIAALGIFMAVYTGQPLFLIVTFFAAAVGISYPVTTNMLLKSAAANAEEAQVKESDINIAVSEPNILIIKAGVPTGYIEWDKITSIKEGKTGFFLNAGKDQLIMLSKAAVVSGTYDEAAQVLREKAAKIKKKDE